MIDVLVPVLNRPGNAAKMAASLEQATASPYRLLFICSPGDEAEIAACEEVGETLVVNWPAGRADFAKKINLAFTLTDSEWVLQGADDISFRFGWDTEAIRLSTRRRKAVVGTNDLHNPAVRQRRHSTHLFFRREYITRYGSGTYDGTGLVFCELYDHQFVDTEFVEVAMHRNEWVFAQHSVVEHLHPYWGLSPRDATYDKAVREAQKDLDLYKSRSIIYDFSMKSRRRVRSR